jgi:hypothetical protein
MNCTECKEKLVELLEGLLSETQRQIVEEHLKGCQQCQGEFQELKELSERLTSDSKSRQQTNLEDVVFNRIIVKQNEKLKQADRINRQLRIWRRIMNSKITKYSAAAVIIIVVVLTVSIFNNTMPTAYAIEQTIEASHSVRYLHTKVYEPGHDEPKEFWVEFDKYGDVKHVRMDFPEWAGGGDGPKIIVWNENIADVWFKRKKSLIKMPNRTVADDMLQMVEKFDPKGVLERLRDQNLDGLVKIDIDQPSNKSNPIVVTATSLPGNTVLPGKRGVLFVDQSTKLVTHIDLYQLKDDEYEYGGTIKFYDYNQRIDPKMFTLDEAPSNVMKIDYTTQEVGLTQGNLTDKEIAVKAVREFYEALIVQDYAKAGQIYSGVLATKMQERWQNITVLQIVSISEPIPHPYPGVGGFQVHCEIEIEKDGVKSIMKPYGPAVRPVHGQPHRWNIHGGVQ